MKFRARPSFKPETQLRPSGTVATSRSLPPPDRSSGVPGKTRWKATNFAQSRL